LSLKSVAEGVVTNYMLAGLETRRPVVWGGQYANLWFRGGPGVLETEAEATCCGPPIEAAYVAALDISDDNNDAEVIIDRLVDYLYDVALAALKWDPWARDIAWAVIPDWRPVEEGTVLGSRLRGVYTRVQSLASDWRYEVWQRRGAAALAKLTRARRSPLYDRA
jgi:hypothetical protein